MGSSSALSDDFLHCVFILDHLRICSHFPMSYCLPHRALQKVLFNFQHILLVQLLRLVRLFVTSWIAARQASLSITNSCTSPSNSHPLSRWCHPAISSSGVILSLCPQSLPASESFPVSQLFTWGGQRTRVSALASPSKEYPGLISFRMDFFRFPCSLWYSQESSPTPQ